MTVVLLWVLCGLLYLLCGQLFCVAYIWNFRSDSGTAQLGLLGLFWPLILVFDLFLSIASAFGAITKRLASRGMQK